MNQSDTPERTGLFEKALAAVRPGDLKSLGEMLERDPGWFANVG